MESLLIVESPTKAKTLKKFLGANYKVVASFGHVRDLPKTKLGVDVDKDFEPTYIIPTKAKKVVAELKKDAKQADEVILATDQDREGESISWHLAEALHLENPKRIVFHEITKTAIDQALKNPGHIDMNLVNAQQARRILDRIVGYKLSPFLWKKISKGLSAGRVQSVAVRLVVEKEREIQKFIPTEYWQIVALLKKQDSQAQFEVHLIRIGADKLETRAPFEKGARPSTKVFSALVKNKTEADEILTDLKNSKYQIEKIEKKETKRNPLPPFTTSTLQQSAWQKFHFPAKMTMSLAQKLYEEGHITYHRTDSLNLSQMSLAAAQKFIIDSFGKSYSAGFKRYKAGKNAQEAHEAIRPTYPEKNPESLKNELDNAQFKLYTLIWQRFIACQMAQALFDSTSVEISAKNYTFSANGQILRFDGFLKVYPMKFQEIEMPKLTKKEILELVRINPSQHFTEPPARYNEATLIKALEKHGIGRPSTYAPTLSTIQDRNYIEKNDQKRFFPTEMGFLVNDILVANFPEIVDIEFTAKMEKELDEIAEGKDTWQKTCRDFYEPFAKNLKEKYQDVQKENTSKTTDKKCPKCASPLLERLGKFGRFYACSAFPKCRYTESLEDEKTKIKCPKCKIGQVVTKKTRKGKIFYGCDYYPTCDFALWDKPIDQLCPKCGAILIETKRKQIKCSSKTCDYKKNALPNSKAN